MWRRTQRVAPIAIIVLVLAGTFGYTVEVRRPHAEGLSYGHHEWLTAHTLKFARAWWQEGAFKLDFLMMETPPDIEHPTLASRQIYPSYPPGAVLAAYLVAKASGTYPSVASLMAFNRALHLFIALCLSLAAWLWIPRGANAVLATVSAIFPGLAYLLLPGPMFWQQNVYFTDTAVIGPFALLLLALAMEDRVKQPWPQVLVSFAFLWGFATDWFFVSVALVWGAVRLAMLAVTRTSVGAASSWFVRLSREVGGVVLAGALAFGFYGWQLSKHALWQHWYGKLTLRTFGTGDGAELLASNFNDVVWGYVTDQYGPLGRVLLIVTFVISALHLIWSLRQRHLAPADQLDAGVPSRATFIAVAALAPLLHTYLLKNHSYLHDFSVLKFAIPLACIPFALLPQAIAQLISKPRWVGPLGIVAATCGGLVYTRAMHSEYRRLVPARNPEIAQIGEFVSRETRYEDVLFSDFAKAEPYPAEPHLLSHTMKLIHPVSNLAQLDSRVGALPAEANVVWLGDSSRAEEPLGGSALWSDAQRIDAGPYYLLRLSREAWLRKVQDSRELAR